MEVRLNLHIYAYYGQDVTPPTYRVWLDDFLFAEREHWIDHSMYFINEIMAADLSDGEHLIKIERVRPRKLAHIWWQSLLVYPNVSQDPIVQKNILTKDVKLSNEYLIPFTINTAQENSR